MKNTGTLKVTTPGDREIVMTRVFDAPRSLVFDALTKPELLKRWFVGPPGWSTGGLRDRSEGGRRLSLRVARPRRNRDGDGRRLSRDRAARADRPHRVVRRGLDRRRGAWARSVLTEQGGKTTLTNTVLYASREARDAVLKTPMEQGVAAGYDRLAELLASTPARGA